MTDPETTVPGSMSSMLRYHWNNLAKEGRRGYSCDSVNEAFSNVLEGLEAMEADLERLVKMDRVNAHNLAQLHRENAQLRMRVDEAEGTVDPAALRIERAQRAAAAQAESERLIGLARQRADGVVRAARQRAEAVVAQAQRKADEIVAPPPGSLPGRPDEVGDRVVDAKARAAWLGMLRQFIKDETPALRTMIHETIVELREAEAGLPKED